MAVANANFYDLVTNGLGTLDNYQGYLDDVMALKYNGLQMDGFAFEPNMQIDFTYHQLQKELDLNIMATYVSNNSKAMPFATKGFEVKTGKIPRMKTLRTIDEETMREMMVLQQRFGVASDRAGQAALNTLFETTDMQIGGHTSSLTYQRHQIVSTRQLSLLDTNNPNGIKNVTFTANVPAGNVSSLAGAFKWWTDATHMVEGATADPIKDLIAKVRYAKMHGLTAMHFEADLLTVQDLCSHTKVLAAIGYRFSPAISSDGSAISIGRNLGYDGQKAALEQLIGAGITTIDSIVSVEKWDDDAKAITRPQMRSFAPDVIVLVPDGQIGTIKVVEPLKLPINNGTYGEFYGGRLLLTVDYDIAMKTQTFESEMTAIVVLNKQKYMYYLNLI